MPTRTAHEWLTWIRENNPLYATGHELTKTRASRMTELSAIDFCQEYIKVMVKQDGKRGLLHQEKHMIHDLGLTA